MRRTLLDMVRGDRGFTLMEMLVTLLIVVLLGIALGVGIPAALKVMHQSTLASNAEVLSSSLDTAVADTLRYSSVYVDDAGVVQTVSRSDADGSYTVPLMRNDSFVDSAGNHLTDAYMIADDRIILREDAVPSGRSECVTNLVSVGSYTDFTITGFRLAYDSASNVFTGSYTIQSKDYGFSRYVEFSCRSLADETTVARG